MKNENKAKKGSRESARNNISLFDHDYVVCRLFDSIFEMDTGSTLNVKNYKTNKTNKTNKTIRTNKINSKSKKGKK